MLPPLHLLHDLIRQHRIKADYDVDKPVARMPDVELKIVDGRAMPDVSVRSICLPSCSPTAILHSLPRTITHG